MSGEEVPAFLVKALDSGSPGSVIVDPEFRCAEPGVWAEDADSCSWDGSSVWDYVLKSSLPGVVRDPVFDRYSISNSDCV